MYDDNGNYQWTLVNGTPIYESPTGILPENIIEEGKPRVYNYAEEVPEIPDTGTTTPTKPGKPDAPTTPTKKPAPSGLLPQLGAHLDVILIIVGLVLMAWVTMWWRLKSKHVENFK